MEEVLDEIYLDNAKLPSLWTAKKSSGPKESKDNLEKRLYALAGKKVVWEYGKKVGDYEEKDKILCVCGVKITEVFEVFIYRAGPDGSLKKIKCCIGNHCIKKFYEGFLSEKPADFEKRFIEEQLDKKKKEGRKTMDCDNCGKNRIRKSEGHGVCEICNNKVERCDKEKRCNKCLWKCCKMCDVEKNNRFDCCFNCNTNQLRRKCESCNKPIKVKYIYCYQCRFIRP